VPVTSSNPFKWRHYPGDVILWCVRWYLRYPLSVAQVAEMTQERGLNVSPSCIWRWVQVYGPELDKRCRHHMKPTNKSWRVDETYIKVNGEESFLYRAVDSIGQTIDFLLTAKRDAAAAKRFFRRALSNACNVMPRVINVDKNRAYPVATDELKDEGAIRRRCRLRQCKYLNNVVEQSHRNVKRRTRQAKGYGIGANGVADTEGDRGDGHDPERKSEASGKGRRNRSGEVHRQTVRNRWVRADDIAPIFARGNFRNGTDGADISGSPNEPIRPDHLAKAEISKGQRSLVRFFDTAAFGRPARGTLGSAARFQLRGPGINNWDIGL
jgi:transposase-like protein